MRWQHQSVIIRVSHYQSTHQAGRYSPGSSPNIIQFIVFVNKLYIERFCEILSQKVRSTTLQCLSILHQAFDGVSIQCTGETFISRFYPFDYRNSHILLSEVTIHMQHFLCFRFCFLAGRMSRMSFLPQELRSTQEQTGTHLPPHNICPLVTQDRQVTIGINPVLICTPNDCLRCRADNQFFFQFGSRIYDNTRTVLCILQTVVSNYSTLFGKSFYVLSFTAKVRFRDKQREISVHVAGFLKHIVQLTLHFLPNGVSVRLDNHTSTHR